MRFENYHQAISTNGGISAESGKFGNNLATHPARPSMGQFLASKGHLVFEGELLDQPPSWHPSPTAH